MSEVMQNPPRDTFRLTYTPITDAQKNLVNSIKIQAEGLEIFLDLLPPSRETSLARTKLEECVMWAVKKATSSNLNQTITKE